MSSSYTSGYGDGEHLPRRTPGALAATEVALRVSGQGVSSTGATPIGTVGSVIVEESPVSVSARVMA